MLFPRLSPSSRAETFRHSPVSRNNPFGTSRYEQSEGEGLQDVHMKLAVLEHQQSALDAKLSDLESYVKSTRSRPGNSLAVRDDISTQLCGQLWEIKEELKLASKEDELHRMELQKQLFEGQKELRRELFEAMKGSKLDFPRGNEEEKSFHSIEGDSFAATQLEVSQLAHELRQDIKDQAEISRQFQERQMAVTDQEFKESISKLQEELLEIRVQINAPSEFEKAFEDTVVSLSDEMNSCRKELQEAFELKLSAQRQETAERLSHDLKDHVAELEKDLEGKLTSQKQELNSLVGDEAKSLRQELEVNSESLRLELQTCLSHKLSDEVSRPMEQLRQEFLQLQEREARHSSVMEEQEQRQVATRVELDRLRQEVSTTSTKLAHLSDLQNCLNEEQVRSIVKEGLEKAKAQMQECLQPFSPLERRLEQLAAEVSRHQTLAARAREELGGLLRAEMQDVAMDAALRQRSLMDSEVRSLLELQRRQFTEALEAAASRASCQLKDISTTHATEVRALASRLTDAERFAQQVGFAVHEMQKHRVKALQNGHPKTAPMDEMLLQQLQKEMQSFVCFSETKTRELQEALVELKATSCEHAVQLQSLASEAVAMNQRLDTALLLETTKVRDGGSEGPPQWTEAMKGMETLTDIVGSLEREGPSSPTVAAVRHELQGELQQVWKVLRQMEARCSATGDAKQTKAKAQVTPKAHPRAKESNSRTTAAAAKSQDSYSEESYTDSEEK